MADNGELPQVGSEFMHQGKVVKTLSTSKEEGGVVTFLDGTDIGCCWNHDAWVNAIDTTTDKEKAIDAIDKLITDAYQEATDSFVSNSRFRIEAAHLMDEIIDGTIAGVEWVGE
jgi:hypothetical protein